MAKTTAAAAALAFAVFLCGCGGSAAEVTADPGTPTHAVQTFIKAIMEGDVETYINSMDIETRKKIVPAAMTTGPDFEQIMKQQLVGFRSQWENVRITGEKITGNTAVVTFQRGG